MGDDCRSGCLTRDHGSYAECLRAATIRIAYCDSVNGKDAVKQKRWDRELSDYRDARRQGIEPDGTTRHAIDKAVKISQETGVAYRAPGMEAA